MVRVGFIGLGRMGAPMAGNLLDKGFALKVFDADTRRCCQLQAKGARVCITPAEVATGVDAVITMLPGPEEVEKVALGQAGILEGAESGLIYLDMSTSGRAVIERIADVAMARGVRVLDAPVSGTTVQASAGKLTIMVGGDTDLVATCLPLLNALGTVYHCGALGAGATMKLVCNLLSQTIAVATGEALALGMKAGLSLETMFKVMPLTGARNVHLESVYPSRIMSGDYAPGFSIDLAAKDIWLALGLAFRHHVPLTFGSATLQLLNAARAMGMGHLDLTACAGVMECIAGVSLLNDPASKRGSSQGT